MSIASLPAVFYFPQVVNAWTARMVALQIVIWSAVVLLFNAWWVVPFLSIGFWLRVGFGPRYSAAAKIASKWLVPLIGHKDKPLAGTPKRFAQLIGAVIATSASLFVLMGSLSTAQVLISVLLFFAFLEVAFDFCAGCTLYRVLAKIRVFPSEICVDCALGKEHGHLTGEEL